MKKTTYTRIVFLTGALALAAIPSSLKASPYASGCTNNGGTVSFYLNEGGGDVTVIYEDGTTNANFNGITTGTNVPEGKQSFSLGAHTGYAIFVHKVGSGVPSQISSDASPFSIWGTPRGMAVNQNPKYGSLFGRIYAGSGGITGSGVTAKYHGLYALNADQSDALGQGTNAFAQGAFASSGSSGPFKMRVAPNNLLLVGDFSGNGTLWLFAPDLSSSNAVFLPTQPAGIHGDGFGTPELLVTNIGGINNYTLWAFDSGMGVPAGTTLGPGTSIGSYNDAERYDIGTNFGVNPLTNPNLLYTSGPNYAYTMGLDGIAELRTEGDIGKDGKIICGFGRANLSNPDIQILDPTGTTVLWTSWNDTGGASDPWAGLNGSGFQVGTYCGVRVSPDGRFFASVDIDNGITIANLTNGIPDDASIFGIQNAPNVGNSRGMDWDAADNLYVISSGQGLMRIWSLGLTTTCITSNDITGTNGTFQLIVPPVTASVVATTPTASQNYVNNASPGTPIPGVFTITLTTNFLALPTTVTYILSGSAVFNTNYTVNTGTDPHGVVITATTVTFPAGLYPGIGNWAANVQIVPTATPVSGPSMSVGVRLIGGANYLAGTPGSAVIGVQNTGPQLLFLTPASSGATMSRSVTNDYAKFIITRWGDTNGPGNSAGGVSPKSFTVTNFTYGGTAVFPADYTAQSQRIDPAGNGAVQLPTDGSPGVVINPGDVTVTAIIGNPVRHANLSAPPVNVTVVISPTNSVTGTNATTTEGYAYSVVPGSVTVTELDNTVGNEIVLWSDPLTNSRASNWTLTFAATNLASGPVLPVVIPNFTNDESAITAGGTNDFRAEFGNPIANDSIPQSPVMAANGWTSALRVTVNKDGGHAQAGVNLYPQGQAFAGNYALRFSMYLSMYSGAINNTFAGTFPYEFALFGVNHAGTNCNWRTSFSIPPNPGYAAPTNADGVWFAIDAGAGSITPADFDAFTSPALPNSGVAADYQSNNSQSQNGVFKTPPFAAENQSDTVTSTGGGEPINQWVDVSVEITLHTNVNVYINRSQVLPSFTLLNGGGNYVSGKPMLGYLDPVPDISDSSAFVYYSNVRVVELAPYIYARPVSLIVTQGANVSFTSSTWLGTPSITNTWYFGTTPTVADAVQTNSANATNITSILSLNNIQIGTNILVVASDPAGSESALASLEVVSGPTNRTVSAGSNTVQFVVVATGPSAPAYRWMLNGANLANSSHYAGVTTSTLTITNAQLADAATYSVVISNPAGTLTNSATLTVNAVQPGFTSMFISGTNAVLNFTTTDPYDNTGSFTLQSSVKVQGPYANTAGTITGSAGSFQFKVPLTTNSTTFYRLVHN